MQKPTDSTTNITPSSTKINGEDLDSILLRGKSIPLEQVAERFDINCKAIPKSHCSATWIDATKQLPYKECEIIFIAKPGRTHERTGIAIPERDIILLSHTDLSFKDLLYWFEMPEEPKQ